MKKTVLAVSLLLALTLFMAVTVSAGPAYGSNRENWESWLSAPAARNRP